MQTDEVVFDTNVFVSALKSRNGASYKLLSMIGGPRFQLNISVALILEYEKAAKRLCQEGGLTAKHIDDIIDYICDVSRHRKIFYLWRPFLPDSKDDMVLELAVSARCDYLITYNKRDFVGAEKFGVKIITPNDYLKRIGGKK